MDDFTRKFDAAQDKDEQIHFILTSNVRSSHFLL